eukprot:TRINITY_DN10369_c0_g1_i1.p2 TRINITY_DN10369_c0_g1~~TRINITY_DN10369_c0_g1_i1.p2  ORF type:complete len:167 (+),score=30.08 TRINITY_DN10369_c0_g1_i1:67-567(+)
MDAVVNKLSDWEELLVMRHELHVCDSYMKRSMIIIMTVMFARISILQNILEWGHLFPTAPDTTCIFPYTHEHRDPFVIADTPNVFFAGNQPTFETAEVQLDSGSSVRLVCVPSFSKTGTVVLVNLRTLECTPVTFGNTVATDHDENDVNGDNDDAMDQEEDTTEDS